MAVSDCSFGVSTTSGVGRIFRYLLTGGVAWLVDVAVFTLCLTSVGILWAQVLARASGAAIGFVGHKFVVFRELDARPANVIPQIAGYGLLWMLSFTVSTVALVWLISRWHVEPLLAKVVVETGIVVLNYLVMHHVIFRLIRRGADA